ncbi:hypothetical protein VE00_09076 [Pseudogymnoascus sp. WSF 3629]|nr:hypothetical protein VE00_09076 [Pseudogymnoascus sp. WSF 3629]
MGRRAGARSAIAAREKRAELILSPLPTSAITVLSSGLTQCDAHALKTPPSRPDFAPQPPPLAATPETQQRPLATAHRRPTAEDATHDDAALKRVRTARAAPLRLRELSLDLAGGGVKDEGRD